ncbi:MAG: hypothetical protein EXR50_03575 [Dehalococcoidia bacterium]|nr:hypothetical protein [Dehalococcoidia bacterium]
MITERSKGLFDMAKLDATRRNHGLEHATVTVLMEKIGFTRRIAGRSTSSGFHIIGNISTEELSDAVDEALGRMQKGEANLAVSPFCGTNLAVSGILSALAVTAVIGSKNRLAKLPNAALAGMLAVIAGQPLGALVQKYVTTKADVYNLRVTGISRKGFGPLTIHKVDTVAY